MAHPLGYGHDVSPVYTQMPGAKKLPQAMRPQIEGHGGLPVANDWLKEETAVPYDGKRACYVPLSRRDSMSAESGNSEKSFVATLILCFLLGGLGVHRFYVGKIGTGILMLLTFGGLGIWTLVDLIIIATQKFKDSKGLLIKA